MSMKDIFFVLVMEKKLWKQRKTSAGLCYFSYCSINLNFYQIIDYFLCPRYGRVNYVLAKRLELLQDVQRLQDSLGVTGDQAYTCETAGHFFLYQVLARWERFLASVKRVGKKVS